MQFEAGSDAVKSGDFAVARDYFEAALLEDPEHGPTIALLAKLDVLAPPSEPSGLEEEDDDDDDYNDELLNDELTLAKPPPATEDLPSMPASRIPVKTAATKDEAEGGAGRLIMG